MHSAVEAGNAATTCFPLHNEAPPSEGRGAIGRLEFRFAQVSSVTAFQSRNWLKILSERFIVDCLLEQEFTSVWALEVEKKKKRKKRHVCYHRCLIAANTGFPYKLETYSRNSQGTLFQKEEEKLKCNKRNTKRRDYTSFVLITGSKSK